MRFSIFPCFQWRCIENWAPQVSASVFLPRLGTFLIQLGFILLNLRRNCELKSFPIAAEVYHFSFWYIDLQISTFPKIPFWILIFFQIINSNWSGVILWQIRRKTLEALGANSNFPLPCPSLLGSKWSTLVSVQLSPAWNNGSDKTYQDSKVGIIYWFFFFLK